MLELLEIVIGIIFMMLLLSLLATTIMELLNSLLSLRGKNLEYALRHMLSSIDPERQTFQAFRENALYKQLCQRSGGVGSRWRRPPSYLQADTFQSILMQLLLNGEGADKLLERIDQLPDGDLQKVLRQLLTDANYELDQFKLQVQSWFDNVMERAGGWYKRHTQQILMGVGLTIAILFNADAVAIYQRLGVNEEARQQLVGLATTYVNANDSLPSLSTVTLDQQVSLLNTLVKEEITAASTPLGLGWDFAAAAQYTPLEWFFKALGWLVTALAISLGAPFWFDLLKKIVNIRSSGPPVRPASS